MKIRRFSFKMRILLSSGREYILVVMYGGVWLQGISDAIYVMSMRWSVRFEV